MSPAVLETGWVILAAAAAVSSGLMLTFSNFVMPAFDRVPPPEAVRAMQRINEAVINPLFLLLFMGTGPLMLLWVWLQGTHGIAWHHGLGVGLYVVGVVGVTIAGNVPLNDRLAGADADQAVTATWQGYARPWVRWNHVRTLAAAGSALVLLLAR